MDLTGSLVGPLGDIFQTLYGSLEGRIGSSIVDTVLYLPGVLANTLITVIASAGADLGSTLGGA